MTVTMAQFLIVTLFISSQAPATGQVGPNSWYGGEARPREVSAQPTVFSRTFSIALPNDWQVASGRAHTIFNVVEKKRGASAIIILEQERLNAPVPSDPETLGYIRNDRLDEVQKFELNGTGFTADVIQGRSGPVILMQYRRPGVLGGEDYVVQYLIPVGLTMYRLTCVAPTPEIDKKYKKIFAWVAASFTPLPSAPAL